MYYRGERNGFSFWRYDPSMDENTWILNIGFGDAATKPPRPGYMDPLYRFQIRVEWRPLESCFEWWVEYLGVERHRGVVAQYRIHSFKRWPVAVRFSSGTKNVYDDHKLVDSDQFWRCDHGRTGFSDGFERTGCWRCAMWRPITAIKAHFEKEQETA